MHGGLHFKCLGITFINFEAISSMGSVKCLIKASSLPFFDYFQGIEIFISLNSAVIFIKILHEPTLDSEPHFWHSLFFDALRYRP